MAGTIEGPTVTVTRAGPDQLPEEACTEYVVEVLGETVIVAAVEPLLHKNVFPPDAVSVETCPEQITVFPVMVGTKADPMVIVPVAVPEHPPLDTNTE